MTSFRPYVFASIPAILLLAIAICFVGCQPATNPETGEPPAVTPNELAKPERLKLEGNGLSNRVFDNCVRVRTRGGTGSGSVIDETPSEYVIESNHHVTSRGTANQLDIFVGGKNVGTVRANTTNSWFRNGSAHDVSEIRIPKSSLGGPLPVVETAPPGYSEKLKPGQSIYTYGCQQGQWPRARHGNILSINNGIIYYEPPAIPGDSGSAIYVYDEELGREVAIGRTAWTTDNHTGRPGGRAAGMAMTSDRVRAIRNGEVSFDELPLGAKPIEPAPNVEPEQTQTEVMLRRWKARNWQILPANSDGPLNLGLGRVRENSMNLRSGIGYAVLFVGLAVAVSIVMGTIIFVVRLRQAT